MQKLPPSLRVLYAPSATFREIAESGKGFGALFGFLAIEFALGQPLTLASNVMRLSASPFAGALSLWSTFVNFALAPAVFVFIAGVVFYYELRRRGRRQELWTAASVLAYAWVPHVLLVGFGVILAGLGWQHDVLPQVPLGYVESDGLKLLKGLTAFGPSAAYATIAVRALLRDAPEPDTPSPPARARLLVLWGATALLLIATGFAGYRVQSDWREVRPLLPGDALPAFALRGLGGIQLQRADIQGEVVLLDFWATWCPPCVASMPHLEKLHREFGGSGFRLVSINTEPENVSAVRSFMEEKSLSFPVYVDTGSLQSRFQVQTLPTAFLVDRDGTVKEVYIGAPGVASLRGDIEELLAN